ncbi:hypothetical protein B0H15DRAFT_150964 [Mycena belliarum]|uniref:Fungal-type protein kinase domain-containing protein n=1 Tax=Mycena belliarum TaxID=1033014 RepID=A0AAD6XWZ7_9AGAR|nr:hypothetical protein B0H15DRAFT_150964 [Mycena belliae]
MPHVSISGVPQVPLEFFFDSVLPCVTELAARVEELLVKEGHIVNGNWTSPHPSTPCGSSSPLERGTELSVIPIFDKVVLVGESVWRRPPNARLVDSSTSTVSACRPPPPDAQIRIVSPHFDPNSCFATAVPCKLRSMRNPEESNERDLIWSCQDVLRDDSRRRFSYGISLDDTDLRIWFFSRSHELVSPPLNYLKEAPRLVQLFLALAFASQEELGYDESMTQFKDNCGAVQYKIQVGEAFYVTTKLLSDHRHDAACGRTTRVWEAYREDDLERTPVALKDLWTSTGAIQEGTQLLDLHERLEALEDPGTPHPPGQYFLTVLNHGYVQTANGEDDHTIDIMTRGCLPPADGPSHARKHYRIVFKEVGTPVHSLQCLSEAMRALADATQALRLLYRLGLIHHDVSAGNILFVDGVGKLSDLEYLRSFKGPSSSQLDRHVIGTADYTSGEVAARRYCFIPSCHDTTRSVSRPPPFRFNPLHDVESTLWVGIWSVSYHGRGNSEAMKELYDTYFPRHFTNYTIDDRMIAISRGLSAAISPTDSLLPTLNILHRLTKKLLKHYQIFEGDFTNQSLVFEGVAPLNGSAFDGVHAAFIAEYEKAAVQCEGIVLAAPDTPKHQTTCAAAPSPVIPTPITRSSERPLKRRKTASPKAPPVTRSSGNRKRRSPSAPPSRRSARLAQKSKASTETKKTSTHLSCA